LAERLGAASCWALPADPAEQVIMAAERLSANSDGQALRLSVMPLGLGPASGSGQAYSADPVTGLPGPAGTFLADATGFRLLEVGGQPLTKLGQGLPWMLQLDDELTAAERAVGFPVRLDFVVERGRLYVLRIVPMALRGASVLRAVARVGRSSTPDPVRLISTVTEDDLSIALAPIGTLPDAAPVARGLAVSPGVASGVATFCAPAAERERAAGRRPVLILREPTPQDLGGLMAAVAVVTQRGGSTSHAAVVMRGMGLPCVVALRDAAVDPASECLLLSAGPAIAAGDLVTVDGTTGCVYAGAATGEHGGPRLGESELADAAGWLLAHAEQMPGALRPEVRVNADSAAEAEVGLAAGAAGIGLCRIEHMLLRGRAALVGQLLTAPPGPEASRALGTLRDFLSAEFAAMMTAAGDRPVTIRLIDPPSHEFLPHLPEREPMLGVRGVRLSLLHPDLALTQLRALIEAQAAVRRTGLTPRPELLVPLVSTPGELTAIVGMLGEVRARLGHAAGPPVPVGAMIETPRAALLAGELAAQAEFLSVGTNDLTALTWGLSRDDADGQLLPAYGELGAIGASPFVSLDLAGVGWLVRHAISAARAVRSGLPVGVCGEHVTSARTIAFLAGVGVDYLSCSAAQVPAARLARARAALRTRMEDR
jgi:pyruvate, orthophosphate dikinase